MSSLELLNKVSKKLVSIANENQINLAEHFDSPEKFKQFVLGFTIKSIVDLGYSMQEAYDMCLGDGEYDKLVSRVYNQLRDKGQKELQNHDKVDYHEGDECPVHGKPHKKTYTFGSTLSAETEVCVFDGCKCAVSIRHDPVGTLPAVVAWHPTYNDATGVGRLHAMVAADKYR